MKFRFVDRAIIKAPLTVLEHLYFYTVQYGLSVKQFTGANQKYWEELPRRLREVKSDLQGLERIIVELEELAAGSELRRQRRRDQLFGGKWAEKEVVLNAQLLSVLAAFPEELLALAFRTLTGSKNLPDSLKIVELKFTKETVFVEPDLLLQGDSHLLMAEIKTRGGPQSSRSYPPRQLINYCRIQAECENSDDSTLPNSFTHLILVPSTEPTWLENHRDWVLTTSDGEDRRLLVDSDALFALAEGKSSLGKDHLREILNSMPIYYRSWEQMEQAFNLAVEQYDDERNNSHWRKIASELQQLAKIARKYK